MPNIVQRLTRSGGPVDRAREAASRIGARPYRLFLVWARWAGQEREVGDGRADPCPVRYEVLPRPVVTGYAGLTRNPLAIGTVPTGTVRVTEVPLWLPYEALRGRHHPEREGMVQGPEAGVEFWYEVEVDGRDHTARAQRFRLGAEPERDEENAQWVLVLERQGAVDREQAPVR